MFDTIFKFLISKAKDYVIRNWKTTVVGLVGGALVRYIPDDQTRQAVLAGVIAALGLLSKDGDKSGTVAQPREPVAQAAPAQAPEAAAAQSAGG